MSSQTVIINDVGPRDGLQNQPKVLTLDQRLQLSLDLLGMITVVADFNACIVRGIAQGIRGSTTAQ